MIPTNKTDEGRSDNKLELLFLEFLKVNSQFLQESNKDIYKIFTKYKEILEVGNSKFNMISQGDIEKVWIRHFQDSLMPLISFHSLFTVISHSGNENISAIDVGSGAGLPGVPIGIILPKLKVTLVDSTGKKISFLKEDLVKALELENIFTVCERAEELAQRNEHREKYNFAFARALAKPVTALEFVLPFLKVGGKAFFWVASGEEFHSGAIGKVCEILGGRYFSEKGYVLEGEGEIKERKIVVVEKVSLTDQKYPRRVGIPQKKPLS